MKKVFPLALALATIISLFPATVLAAAEEQAIIELLPPKYDHISEFHDGLAFASNYGGYYAGREYLIDQDGKEITPDKYVEINRFSEGLVGVQDEDGKIGFIDSTGKEVIPCQYDGYLPSDFSEGLASVCKGDPDTGGKWGFIDSEGNEVIPFRYDLAGDFHNGLAAVYQGDSRKDGKWGFIDKSGKEIIPCKYDEVGAFDESGFALFGTHTGKPNPLGSSIRDTLWGLIDKTGKEITACKYRDIKAFSEGYAAVARGSGKKNRWGFETRVWGFIDTTGKEVIPCKYSRVTDFSQGTSVVNLGDSNLGEEELCGVIDTAGKVVIPIKYDLMFDFSPEGYAQIEINTHKTDEEGYEIFHCGLIDRAERPLIPLGKYSDVDDMREGMAAVAIDSEERDHRGITIKKYGFVDMAGDEVVPCQYDGVGWFENGYAKVWNWRGSGTKLMGMVDKTGKVVVPLEYYDVGTASEGFVAVGRLDENGLGMWGFVDVSTGKEVTPFLYSDFGNEPPIFHEGLAPVQVWEGDGTKYALLKIVPASQIATSETVQQETPSTIPATGTAYPSAQTVDVDGKQVEFQCYALKDENGNDTNYIKLRDIASILNGTAAQFEVGWDGSVTITTGQSYTQLGSEQSTPFSGQREYVKVSSQTIVNGEAVELSAFTLTDDNGGGYTYYKLRDLGTALGFKVDWSAQRGIFIETE